MKNAETKSLPVISETAPGSPARNARSEESEQRVRRQQALDRNMRQIGRKLLVLSGKGGVGKSTVAANLAGALAQAGRRVGLLDVDVHGPSVPRLMGVEAEEVHWADEGMLPVAVGDALSVMSIGFLLPSKSEPVMWRGPRKHGVIQQFLADVAWGSLDCLVVDAPPGTGDEPMSIAQLVGPSAGAIIVTTPQELALDDVRRCIAFCREASLPIVGVVENMSGMACPKCGEQIDLFKRGGGRALAKETGVSFLGRIPIDPAIAIAGDSGRASFRSDGQTTVDRAFADVVAAILADENS